MNVEVEVVFALWQKIVQAQLVWLKEISDAHGVEVTLSFYEERYFVHNSDRFAHLSQVLPEVKEMRDAVDRLYANVSYTLGDPTRVAVRYRVADDLRGRTPKVALIQIGLVFIDAVLIGPVSRASVLLASNPRLYKSALERARYINEDGDLWLPRVQQAIAGADALLARSAIDTAIKVPVRKVTTMDEEVGLVFSLWQEIETGKAAWVEEISLRHGVPASEHLGSVYSLRLHAEGPAADAAMVDCIEVLSAVTSCPETSALARDLGPWRVKRPPITCSPACQHDDGCGQRANSGLKDTAVHRPRLSPTLF